jgi:hypothetical protein
MGFMKDERTDVDNESISIGLVLIQFILAAGEQSDSRLILLFSPDAP